jgi:hypothetical protein
MYREAASRFAGEQLLELALCDRQAALQKAKPLRFGGRSRFMDPS